MKAFVVGILFFILVGIGAYVWLKYYSAPASQTYTTEAITKTGILQKSTIAMSDFTHVIVNAGTSVGVASFTLNLDDYIGKKVSATGQYSGDTLFADSITIIP